jgi:hypothetical protein
MDNSLVSLSAVTARELIGRRKLSPVELLDACITQIEAINPAVNAVAATCFERAREEARRATRENSPRRYWNFGLKPGKARFLSARGLGARLRTGEGLPGGEFGDESSEEVHEWRVPVQISGLCEKRTAGKSLHRGARTASQTAGAAVFLETQFRKVDLFFADAVRQLDAGNDDCREAEPFKAEHDVRPRLDVAIVLLDHVVQIRRGLDICVLGQEAAGLHLTYRAVQGLIAIECDGARP